LAAFYTRLFSKGASHKQLEEKIEEFRPESKISRYDSIFAFETFDDALSYRKLLRPGAHVYIVKPLGDSTRADMRCVDEIEKNLSSLALAAQDADEVDIDIDNDESFQDLVLEIEEKNSKVAKNYWSEQQNSLGKIPIWEHICSSVEIVKKVNLEEMNENLIKNYISELISSCK
jgi:hypothetical protein